MHYNTEKSFLDIKDQLMWLACTCFHVIALSSAWFIGLPVLFMISQFDKLGLFYATDQLKTSPYCSVRLPCMSRGYFMVKFTHLDYAFSEFFELEVSLVEGQSLKQKIRKGEKGNLQKKAWRCRSLSCPKMKHFCACLSKNVIKHGACGKKGMPSCCKCLFE